MDDKRKSLAKDLNIPVEDASRLLIEKEKAITQSELRYHVKAMCTLLDKLRTRDSYFAEQMMKESVRFLLARHATPETLEEIQEHIESLNENFLEREITDRLKDDY